MRSKKCSFLEALHYIQSVLHIETERKVGFLYEEEIPKRTDDWDLLDKYARLMNGRKPTNDAAYTRLPPTLIDYYSKVYPVEWQRDGVSCEAMKKFNIRFNIVDNEVIIPHYDINGELIGIRSRTLDPVKVAAGYKYMPTQLEAKNGEDFRHSLRNHLYGLDKTKEAIKRIGKVMITEAEKGCLQCETFYGDNNFTVAVCGSNISTIQRDLILGLGVREVFIAFDKEYYEAYSEKSDEYADKILRYAGLFSPYVTTYVLWDTEGLLGYKDSPTDKGQETLEKLMKNKFEVETVGKKKG